MAALTPGTPAWPERLNAWEEALSDWAGPWVTEEWAGGITGFSVLSSLAALLAVILALWLVRGILRGKIRKEEAEAKGPEAEAERDWHQSLKLIFEVARGPLALLIWVYGLYLVLSLLFLRWRIPEEPPLVIRVLDGIRDAGVFIVLFWFLFRMIGVIDLRMRARAARTKSHWDDILAPLAGRSLRIILPLLALHLAIPLLPLTPELDVLLRHGFSLTLILGVALLLFQLVGTVSEGIARQFPMDVRDNLQARKIFTQATVLKKVAQVVIAIFTLASMLMVFEPLRQLGASILASAGIAGIIIGFAAQKSIATLVAGFQIALTQPIRVDDVVIVENEWGRIEEINLTYVVVRIWDLRRLIVPITYFIESTFQNWTRVSADILGTVFLHLDYTVPLEAVRAEFDRLLDQSKYWDKKVKVIHVTDALAQTLQVRLLMSARDAGLAWDLRCEVREKMVRFLQQNYPDCLPRLRAELSPFPSEKQDQDSLERAEEKKEG